MVKKKTNERGITLISLVITVVILLILAGVAINLAVDGNGLFGKAGEAANSWNSSIAEEGTAIGELLGTLDKISPSAVTLSTDLPQGWSSSVVSQVAKAGNRQAPIPEGFVASGVEGENTIARGLVIYQTENAVTAENHNTALTTYNQYVWIPVDDINDMVMCSVCKGTSENLVYNDTTKTLACTNTHAEGTTPTLVGKLYTTYVEGGSTTSPVTYEVNGETKTGTVYTRRRDFEYAGQEYSDTYTGYREPAVVTGSDGTSCDGATDDYHGLADANAFLAQLQGDFNNMAKSVAKYGGFYVGRYEAGAGGTTKKGQTVMTAATDNQMWYGLHNTLRSDPEVASSTYSQMIWGSQYDQMIKFLEEDASNEPYIGHTDRVSLKGYLASGNAPADEMSNIFDLEGNYMEWTAEADRDYSRIVRGRSLLRRE